MKKLTACLLVTFLLTVLCGTALAAGPTCPGLDRLRRVPVKPRVGDISGRAYGFEAKLILDTEAPDFDTPVCWHIETTGGTAPFTYEYYLFNENGTSNYLDCFYGEVSSESSWSFIFEYPGYYELVVYVTDATGDSTVLEDYFNPIVLEEDASHPSVETLVASVVADCPSDCSTQYDKALWAHDYLTHHAYYDFTYCWHGAPGVLFKGTGVCDSYSLALAMMLRQMGISAGRVSGGDHAWVIAKLEGNWYMIDPTWDDPGSDTAPVSGNENHTYFCVTDTMLSSDHTIALYDEGYNYLCRSLECNYLVRSGAAEFISKDECMIFDYSDEYGYIRRDNYILENELTGKIRDGGIYWSVELPEVYRESEEGDYYYADIYVWDPVAYVMSRKQREVDGFTAAVRASADPAELRMYFTLDTSALPCLLLPEDMIALEEGIFESDSAVLGVRLSENAETIGANAFAGCSALRYVSIPSSVSLIDANAFDGCNGMQIIAESGSYAAAWAAENGFEVVP